MTGIEDAFSSILVFFNFFQIVFFFFLNTREESGNRFIMLASRIDKSTSVPPFSLTIRTSTVHFTCYIQLQNSYDHCYREIETNFCCLTIFTHE